MIVLKHMTIKIVTKICTSDPLKILYAHSSTANKFGIKGYIYGTHSQSSMNNNHIKRDKE